MLKVDSMAQQEKLLSMRDAIGKFVKSDDTVYLGGFLYPEPFAAIHEILRQGKKNLTLSRVGGMLPVDQMIGAGAVKRLITSFTWNPLPTTAHCFVRAVTHGIPHPIEVEEYSLLALNLAYFAGAMDLPYIASKTVLGSGFDHGRNDSGAKNMLRFEESPFNGERVCLVPPIKHDVGIMQVQRSDPFGNAQAWGMAGESRYGIQSCDKIIICAEEIVSNDTIMSDPNRTLVPGFRVSAVVEEPWGSHPAPMTGHYDQDWLYYAYYERETKTEELLRNFLKKWVYGVKGRAEYLKLLEEERLKKLCPKPFRSTAVSYGELNHHPWI